MQTNSPSSQPAEGFAQVQNGVVVEIKVGESVTLRRGNDEPITLIVEPKSGQRARLRIQASEDVQIGRPGRKKTPAYG